MSDVITRFALAEEYPRLFAAYTAWGYGGAILPDDVVFVAEHDGEYVGIVRRTWEHGTLMLRGMYVAPHARGIGVGTKLLLFFVHALDEDPETRGRPCYGIPFGHLEPFYSQGGFEYIALDEAPDFLRRRVDRYIGEGHVVAIMRRTSPVPPMR